MATESDYSNDSGPRIRCMWVDTSVHDAGANQDLQKKLCDIFGRSGFFEDMNTARRSIQASLEGSKFVLVVSGQIGSRLVPLIHDDPRVCAIYIYCGSVEAHQSWSQPYAKVKFITNNPSKLIEKITTDKPTF